MTADGVGHYEDDMFVRHYPESDQLAAFNLLRTDTHAAESLRAARDTCPTCGPICGLLEFTRPLEERDDWLDEKLVVERPKEEDG